MQPLALLSLDTCSLLAESHRAAGNCVGHSCLLLWPYNSSLTHTGGEKVYRCIILSHFLFYLACAKTQLASLSANT